MRVTVAWSAEPRQVQEQVLLLALGATVADALAAAGWPGGSGPGTDPRAVGVWGRKASLTQPLKEGDRVEVYRPLQVDPKVARRERFRRQGARSAGLFAQRRPGAKPGY